MASARARLRPTTGGGAAPPAEVAVQQGDLRGRILRTATAHFAERGYGATSIREVVEAVGCTKPALYYYFPSKEALFLEALADPLNRYGDLLASVATTALPFRQKVRLLVEQILHHVAADPVPMRLVLTCHLRPERGQPSFDVEAARAATELATVALVHQGLEEGAVRGDIAPEHIARFLMGLLHETAMESVHRAAQPCTLLPPPLTTPPTTLSERPAPAYDLPAAPPGLSPATPATVTIALLLTDLFFDGVKP